MRKQGKTEFLNESSLNFDDISAEIERTYTFPNGLTYTIKSPKYLNVSSSGGHRIYTQDGYSYYIKPNESWAIKWKVKDGDPNFVR